VISRGAHVNGTVAAERVVVDGNVEGPIEGGDVFLKSQANVVGDIHHQSLAIEKGASFEGRSIKVRGGNGHSRVGSTRLKERLKEVANENEDVSAKGQ
jgi:cytoskeletal protein CcmA (bactofilin family)